MSAKYAVVNVFGRQYKVKEGESIKAALCPNEVGESLEFPEVLLLSNGGDVKIGTPTVSGAKVTAKVENHGRDPKVLVFKYLHKNKHKKSVGHKQPFTTLNIEKIEG